MKGSSALPEQVDPFRLAVNQGSVQGEIPLKDMRRLAEYLLPVEAGGVAETAKVTMQFSQDSQRRTLVSGSLSAQLRLQCQRCLLGLDWPVKTEFTWAVVDSEEAADQVPRELDPVLIETGMMSPAEVAEDELILALPAIARCEDDNCPHAPEQLAAGKASKNPFAVLREIDFNDVSNDKSDHTRDDTTD